MKVKIFSTKLGEVFDPSKDYTPDKTIVLNRHPVEKTEGATKGYLDMKMDEFYKTANIQGTIDDISVLKLEGPEIVHDVNGLWLKKLHGGFTDVVIAEVDKYGRISKQYPVEEEYMDNSLTINWSDITNKPTTVEGYGITDLASKNKYETITGKINVTYQNRNTLSPVPYSFLKTIWDTSGYELKIGDCVLKFGKISDTNWIPAEGQVVTRTEYPELVTALAGANANSVSVLDARHRDSEILSTYGLEVSSYIKAK